MSGQSVIDRNARSPTESWLLQEHGPLLCASAAAKVLGFKSTDALRQARIRQRLPIPMFTIKGRRGWFASTETVAAWLERTVERGANMEIRPNG
jgi:hypothetical protein